MTLPLHDPKAVAVMLEDIREATSSASQTFDNAVTGFGSPDYDTLENAGWQVENVFLKLLAVVESLHLDGLKGLITADLLSAKEPKDGFTKSSAGPDGPYSAWLSRAYQYMAALDTLGGSEVEKTVTKDLTGIIRATIYPITDTRLFGRAPVSEADVHDRIEGVLRCVFPDLKRKPALSKAIKNFEPDTALPSLATLIEYKFIDSADGVKTIADQILADTRGYVSKEWHTFLYVIYETGRFRPEREWSQLLRDCEIPASTSVVVLSGEPRPVSLEVGKAERRRPR